jgi:hypothetical protein
MGKRKKKTKPTTRSKPVQQKDEASAINTPADEDKPFDFGGLPSRDLKKNLGCG